MKRIVAPRLLALASLLLGVGCATGLPPESLLTVEEVPRCGGQPVPPGWPERSSDDPEALLKPFLSCASPAGFLALQQHVDMPRLVARLDAWHAVRLGALGPVLEEAAGPLNRQRTTFLLQSLERYGAAHTEVLAAFVLDTSHDDDLRDILFRLAQDKRLVELLEQLPSLGPALEARGFKPSAHAERDFQWSDVSRGLERAGRDALATSPMANGLSSTLMELRALEAQLPPPYQRLAPTAVLVAVYAGGKGAAWLAEARGASEAGPPLTDEAVRPSERHGPSLEHAGGVLSLVDEQVGLTREVVETRLAQQEVETRGPACRRT